MAGFAGAAAAERHQRGVIALIANLVALLFCGGLMSFPGAILAGLSFGAGAVDPARADRLIKWSWIFLASNMIFYLLLFLVFFTAFLVPFLATI